MSGRTISFQPKQHTILDPRGPKNCNYTMIIRNYTTNYCIGVCVCFSLYEAGGRLSAGVAYIAVFQIFTYVCVFQLVRGRRSAVSRRGVYRCVPDIHLCVCVFQLVRGRRSAVSRRGVYRCVPDIYLCLCVSACTRPEVSCQQAWRISLCSRYLPMCLCVSACTRPEVSCQQAWRISLCSRYLPMFVCFSLYEAGGRLSAGVAYIAVFQIFTYLYFTDEYLLSPDFQVWNYSQIILTFDVLTTLSD